MKTIGFTSLSLALLLASAPAAALNLTGTWAGKFNCSGFDGEKFFFVQKGQSLEISQTVDDKVSVLWLDKGKPSASYSGFVLGDLRNAKVFDAKGRMAIAACGTKQDLTTGFSEIVNLTANLNRAIGKGTLVGASLYTDTFPISQTETGHAVVQCQWIYHLVDTADPHVGTGDCAE